MILSNKKKKKKKGLKNIESNYLRSTLFVYRFQLPKNFILLSYNE